MMIAVAALFADASLHRQPTALFQVRNRAYHGGAMQSKQSDHVRDRWPPVPMLFVDVLPDQDSNAMSATAKPAVARDHSKPAMAAISRLRHRSAHSGKPYPNFVQWSKTCPCTMMFSSPEKDRRFLSHH